MNSALQGLNLPATSDGSGGSQATNVDISSLNGSAGNGVGSSTFTGASYQVADGGNIMSDTPVSGGASNAVDGSNSGTAYYLKGSPQVGPGVQEIDGGLGGVNEVTPLQDADLSGFALRNATLEENKASTTSFIDQLRGSVAGDVTANTLSLLTNSGTGSLEAANAVYSLFTDSNFQQQTYDGLKSLFTNPGAAYDSAVDRTSAFFDESGSQQATDLGQAGINFLTGLGVVEAAKYGALGLGNIGSYALDNFGTGPSFGSLRAQIGAVGDLNAAGQPMTIGDYFPDVHPNSMLHLTAYDMDSFANGIDSDTFFAKLGDVSHLTPQQYRIGVVGGLAGGYGPDATLFVVVSPEASADFGFAGKSLFGYSEYTNPASVMPSRFTYVPPGPALPYEYEYIPPPKS